MERNLPHGFSYLTPGIRRLNAIRNRLSHTLKGEISEDDVNVFMGIPLFKSMRVEAAKRFSPAREPSSEPIAILEDFAQHAGSVLHSVSTMTADVWAKAIDLACQENIQSSS